MKRHRRDPTQVPQRHERPAVEIVLLISRVLREVVGWWFVTRE